MHKLKPLLALMTGCVFTAAFAAPALAATTVVNCGKLLDVKNGVWRDKVSITIEDKKILSITPWKTDAKAIDLSQFSCLPGLIDMHVHLSHDPKPQVEQLRERLTADPADYAYASIKLAERTLLSGFTTVRDLGAADGLNVSMKRAIEAGSIVGPRLFTAGKSIATTGGHADPSNGLSMAMRSAIGKPGPEQGVINGIESAREAVRSRYQEGADLIKITATAGVLSQASSGENTQFSDEELNAIIKTAKDYGFRVAAHAHGNEGIKRALRAGIDSIEHGTYMDDEAIALFKKHGAWYVPTISAGKFVAEKAKVPHYFSPLVQPKAAAIGPLIQSTFTRAYKAGVKIAFGTDAGVFPNGDNAKEFRYMVEAGMPELAAIRSATLSAAELLNQSQRLGSIENNFAADIIAVKGDPLKDISQLEKVEFVMKDGVVYKTPMQK
ncbi:MAG: amidohydrolase family protein [Candidatus Aquirickettsiella gammari]